MYLRVIWWNTDNQILRRSYFNAGNMVNIIFHQSNIVINTRVKDMELLPICKVTYTNECDASDVSFLKDIVRTVGEYVDWSHIYFVDLCYCCNVSIAQPLLRCNGCQLVAYCSIDCQKKNWNNHKELCKEFPLVKGRMYCTPKVPGRST